MNFPLHPQVSHIPFRPLFVGNLENDVRVKDLERAFDRFGSVTGETRRAVDEMDGSSIGDSSRRMGVELAKGDGDVKR